MRQVTLCVAVASRWTLLAVEIWIGVTLNPSRSARYEILLRCVQVCAGPFATVASICAMIGLNLFLLFDLSRQYSGTWY